MNTTSEIDQLVLEIQSLEEQLENLREKLHDMSDGHIYLTCLRCWGSLTWNTYTNQYPVQSLCDEYNGDNGIVDVYTTNANFNIYTYGDVKVMSLEEIKNMTRENVSMSSAMTNWIARGL